MRRFAGVPLYMIGGALAGVVSAYAAVQTFGNDAVNADSPWLSRAAGLTGNAGFYVRSSYLLEGRLPPAAGQLAEAFADTDSDGHALSTTCAYDITSIGALPRWWSIAAVVSATRDPSRQSVVDAETAIRESDGTVHIVAASVPQPGNWLKQPSARRFSLLYSAVPMSNRTEGRIPPFRITQTGC